jgi:hypothetical protein
MNCNRPDRVLLAVLDAEVTPEPLNDDAKDRLSDEMDRVMDRLVRKLSDESVSVAGLGRRILARCQIETEWWDNDFRVLVYAPWTILLEHDDKSVASVIQHVQSFLELQMELGLWDMVLLHGHVFDFTLDVIEYEEV